MQASRNNEHEPVIVGGVTVGFAKITRDRTNDHSADEQLSAVHRNLKIALTYMSQGLALYDAEWSADSGEPKRLCEMCGVSCEQVRVGMRIAEVMGVQSGSARRRARRLEERIHCDCAGRTDGPDV